RMERWGKKEKQRRACRQAAQRRSFLRHKCHPSVHSKNHVTITVSQEAMSNSALQRSKKPVPGKVFKVYAITFRYALIAAFFLASVA
ncbi:hypothetical protein, partial [Enterobacter hormaechei]